MLVLSRKVDESLVLYHDGVRIGELQVVDIRGDKVRLGVKNAPDVEVYREELVGNAPTSPPKLKT